LAEDLILKGGGESSFKKVPNYNWTTCININQGVVHGIPGEYRIKPGDVVSIDLGNLYQGLHTDMARTLCVRNPKSQSASWRTKSKKIFLEAGKRALAEAIKMAKPGSRVGHISKTIEKFIKQAGCYPVKELTGHGVGKKLHEPPPIPGYLSGDVENTPVLEMGMVLAIEVIYAQTKTGIKVGNDNWTVETNNGSLAGLFEDTILVTQNGPENLTEFS
jgi:methionyl aminopeptidase